MWIAGRHFTEQGKTAREKKRILANFQKEERVRKIRYTRVRKFESKYKKYVLGCKIIILWYGFLILGMQWDTGTNASFNDIEKVSATIETDVWSWDRSSLQFSDKNKGYGFCSSEIKSFYSELINVGEKMMGSSAFEIYYVESGEGPNKKNPGVKIFTGEIPALKSGQTIRLLYTPDLPTLKTGKYKFKAYQRPGHGDPQGKDPSAESQELWGQEIAVTKTDIDACKIK